MCAMTKLTHLAQAANGMLTTMTGDATACGIQAASGAVTAKDARPCLKAAFDCLTNEEETQTSVSLTETREGKHSIPRDIQKIPTLL